jgi:hypothetical protein
MKTLSLTEEQLNEASAKIANELEEYGSQASDELKQVFKKLMKLKPTRKTLLMVKFEKKIK